ncbi:hypothetical protein [Pseudomonas sp. RIT-PI-AD]|uniref:hypothetical protein n=1 Tax=Pseudomonas sp. RIT-PI-AD TaxID=3035294 RepID=UPI0021D9C1E6|nr:hypothetical protein [Pseudomonas sp. RIT-PI-AD]
MICANCFHEPTLSQLQGSPDKCPQCGVRFDHHAKRPSPKYGRLLAPKVAYLLPLLIGLIAGYFVGREHIKYEIRTTMQHLMSGVMEDSNKSTVSSKRSKAPPIGSGGPINVVLNGTQRIVDAENRVYSLITVKFFNRSGAEVNGFRGDLVITDTENREILRAPVHNEDHVENGGEVRKYFKFMIDPSDAKLSLLDSLKGRIKLHFVQGD